MTLAIERNRTEESLNCGKCSGTGRVMLGLSMLRPFSCFKCNGTGKLTIKQRNRDVGREKAKVTRAANLEIKIDGFKTDYPEVYDWLRNARGSFGSSLYNAVQTYGNLTEKQLAAVVKVIEKNKAEAAERAAADSAPAITESVLPVVDAFKKAKMLGAKRSKIRLSEVVFSLAPDSGKNADHIYIKSKNGTYLGKVAPAGVFSSSRDCTPELREVILRVGADPLTAAIDYGRMSGECACCGRELTDQQSIDEGIGPVCKQKFFQ